jgi:transposase-like protein
MRRVPDSVRLQIIRDYRRDDTGATIARRHGVSVGYVYKLAGRAGLRRQHNHATGNYSKANYRRSTNDRAIAMLSFGG